jgi:hypothetical protein
MQEGLINVFHSPSKYDGELATLCSSFGEILSVRRIQSRHSSSTPGSTEADETVEVRYEELQDATAAARNMNGMDFFESSLTVILSKAT